MATIKHTSSKNADYSAAEAYLIFQHDEVTGRVLKDNEGRPLLREEYLLDTLECGGEDYAIACLQANRKYHQNTLRKDVKSHQYILSFDPRDTADHGLTMERAQALGLEFCKKHFAGHPSIVCTHPDGHNQSGNIHVHIIIGNVRVRDVEHLPYMEKPCDWEAGKKHRCTAAFLRYLRSEVMELCQREGLYQIDLLNGRKERITEREYWAQQRGQRELDRQAASVAESGSVKATKYETTKAILRRNIRAALALAANLDEFSTILLQEYGIELRESRGRFSYLPPDRTKPITARMLGDDFSKEAVLAALGANRVRGVGKVAQDKRNSIPLQSKSKNADTLRKLIDIQAKLAAGKGAGYERWAKVFNLKQLSKTLLFLQEHGIQSEAMLNSAIDKADAAVSETTAVIKDLEQRIAANRELQTQVVNYHCGRGVAAQAKADKNPAAFREEHRAELLPYETA